MKNFTLIFVLLLLGVLPVAAQKKTYLLKSPDNKIIVTIEIENELRWSVNHQNTSVLKPSALSMELSGGEYLGKAPKLISAETKTINETFSTPFYKKQAVQDHYQVLKLIFKGDYCVEFRAYNDAVAYRFLTSRKTAMTVVDEQTDFVFENDSECLIPFVRDLRDGDRLHSAFEAHYDRIRLSKVPADTLAFLPMLIELKDGKKACLLEADLEEYPGMFVRPLGNGSFGMKGYFARYPKKEKLGGFAGMNQMVKERENYLVKTSGNRTFPWRIIAISKSDAELANNDIVQKLAAPSRIQDISWIKPGKVAWDWWNDWNISHVNFVAGVNNETYRYYIDFASDNKIEYVVLDEGWSSDTSLLDISEKINVEELVRYAAGKNVGIILWASWYALQKDTRNVFATYAKMGVKGFKIDFIDRDDAKMVSSLYALASLAAEHHLLVDYHGVYKPTGLQRTFPNILNMEGVKGLENAKWTQNDDMPLYDVTIPFIRMMAGPMDYTPGAMRNATKSNFHPLHTNPMSQGTRCHQMAMYTVFDAPLQMLADNPTAYKKEQECTDFISLVPTVFDETIILSGKVGEYIAVAKRKGNVWYLGALTNWDSRSLKIDLYFLGEGSFEAIVFQDGLNAHRNATDYKKETIPVSGKDNLTIMLSNGGGWTARIIKK